MSELPLAMAKIFPALSYGVSGIVLLRTRSRHAGALMVATAVGAIASALVRLAGAGPAAQVLLVGSVALPMSMSLLAYPRARFAHAVDYCTWIVVGASGVIATLLALELDIAGTLGAVTILALIGHVWWVLEGDDEEARQAVLWLSLSVVAAGLLLSLLFMQFGAAGAVVGAIPVAAIGPAMVVGVRRPGLVDVRWLVVEVVVFGVAALTYLSVFMGTLGALALAGYGDPAVGVYAFLAIALAAVFQPLRVALRGLVHELLFGDRPDPLRAATTVATRVGDDPVLALRAIREALALPYASISADGVSLASSGTATTDTRRFPLVLGSDTVGEIVVGLRVGDLALSPGDRQVLRIVAPLVAQTVRARALALDLTESRESAIAAIEEERRRLRRDLHDGLGPTLSGIAHTADAARNTLTSDPSTADELLRRLRIDATAAVGEIRRLVYDMRPPALDELGVVAALRQQMLTIRTPDGRPMHVTVDATDLPVLVAAVEVALYRIVIEAVTNVARHSDTNQAWVLLQNDLDNVTVTIRDAGSTAGTWTPGVGISSMRERAAEVGGTLSVAEDGDGFLVRARLPISGSTSARTTPRWLARSQARDVLSDAD